MHRPACCPGRAFLGCTPYRSQFAQRGEHGVYPQLVPEPFQVGALPIGLDRVAGIDVLRQVLGEVTDQLVGLRGTAENAVYDSLGEPQRALAYFQQALPLIREGGDRAGEAATLNNIGHLYDGLGDRQRALTYCSVAPSWRLARTALSPTPGTRRIPEREPPGLAVLTIKSRDSSLIDGLWSRPPAALVRPRLRRSVGGGASAVVLSRRLPGRAVPPARRPAGPVRARRP